MYNVSFIHNVTEFLDYTQLISLLQDQMEYIGSPKTNEELFQHN